MQTKRKSQLHGRCTTESQQPRATTRWEENAVWSQLLFTLDPRQYEAEV
jgi:hypothetical protein